MRALPSGLFALAAASPLVLIAAAALFGGPWPLASLLWMALAAVALDLALPWVAPAGEDREFPAADALLALLALAGLAIIPLLIQAVAGASGLGPGQRLALALAAALWFGQVGHPAAHELIHRPRPLFLLGVALYSVLLFGHHASAHRLVHHRFVGTKDDPNSAREGEGVYRFFLRAWPGSFRAGLRAESALRGRSGQAARGLHPYVVQLCLSLGALALAFAIAGWAGLLAWWAIALHFGFQVLLSDYVQHYGLRRGADAQGRLPPVGPTHSWNSSHWFSSAMMLNAPRHSDHHMHPARPFPALTLPPEAPQLPWPLPLAALIALVPRLWKRRMRLELDRPGRRAPSPGPLTD